MVADKRVDGRDHFSAMSSKTKRDEKSKRRPLNTDEVKEGITCVR